VSAPSFVFALMAGVSVFIAPSKSGKNIFPEAAFGPSDEAIIDRFLWAVVGRAVCPSPTRFQNMHDAAQNAAIIETLQSACVLRQQRRDMRPLLIGKSKQINHVRASSLEDTQARLS
jgi:hypothetical protein